MLSLNLEDIVTRIRRRFPDKILKRGWSYHLDGAVTNLKTDGETVIRARVHGTRKYHVEIDLDSFSSSSCNCPYDGCCKHMAAVLFEALDMAGLPANEFLFQAAASSADDSSYSEGKPTKKSHAKSPEETESVEDWHRYFTKQFGKPRKYGPFSIDSFYVDARQHLDRLCQDWDPVTQAVYRLHVWLFVILRVEEMYNQFSNSYFYYDDHSFYRVQAARWLDELVQIVADMDKQELRERHPQHLLATIDFLARNAFPSRKTITDWSFVYRFLWGRLLNDEQWNRTESLRLQSELAKPQPSLVRRDALVMASLHFDILNGNDSQAMEMAEKEISSKNPALLWGYLQFFRASEQWGRLLDWLKWMQPLMKRSGQESLRVYLDYWQEVQWQENVEDDWVQTLLYLLPASYDQYAGYLIAQERYQEWVDLNLLYGVTPFEVNPSQLKKVEAENLSLVLPLYHQAVESHVLQKSRESYQQAVRLLKKLEQHYGSLQERPRWTRYIEYLGARYSRYRTFQEELRKGKLIP